MSINSNQSSVTLYHFCPKHLLPSIKKYGLVLGAMPTGSLEKPALVQGFRWLTQDKNFSQPWCKGSTLPYDRTAVRIKVTIKEDHWLKLFPWPLFKNINPLYYTLSQYSNPDDWYVFFGDIPPSWFSEITFKPS